MKRLNFFVFGLIVLGFVFVSTSIVCHFVGIEKFKNKALVGEIVSIKETQKGFALINAKGIYGVYELPSIIFMYELTNNNISVGDSLLKYRNSNELLFFTNNGMGRKIKFKREF